MPLFLSELRENGGFVSTACRAVAISKQGVYNWREAHKDFADAWDKAVELATEDLEREARRRALEGVEEPVFYKGVECGRIRKYSDTLLMFAIKARKPEYRDVMRFKIEEADGLIDAAVSAGGLPAIPAAVQDETEKRES